MSSLSKMDWKDIHFDNTGGLGAANSFCGLSSEDSSLPVSPTRYSQSNEQVSASLVELDCHFSQASAISAVVDAVLKRFAGTELATISKKALCLTSGSLIHDFCGLEVHFGYLAPLTKTTPPEWLESVLWCSSKCTGSKVSESYVVDFAFQSKFNIARSTPQYNRYLATLPEVFIGTAQELEYKVHRATAAMEYCLRESDLPVAPWRKSMPILSMYRNIVASSESKYIQATLARVKEGVVTHRDLTLTPQVTYEAPLEKVVGAYRAMVETANTKLFKALSCSTLSVISTSQCVQSEEEYFEKVSVYPTNSMEVSNLAIALNSRIQQLQQFTTFRSIVTLTKRAQPSLEIFG